MSDTQITTPSTSETKPAVQPKASIADTIVDFGLVWADKGIGFGKTALENSARALDRTAKCLETYQGRLKSAVVKPAVEAPVANGSSVAARAA